MPQNIDKYEASDAPHVLTADGLCLCWHGRMGKFGSSLILPVVTGEAAGSSIPVEDVLVGGTAHYSFAMFCQGLVSTIVSIHLRTGRAIVRHLQNLSWPSRDRLPQKDEPNDFVVLVVP